MEEVEMADADLNVVKEDEEVKRLYNNFHFCLIKLKKYLNLQNDEQEEVEVELDQNGAPLSTDTNKKKKKKKKNNKKKLKAAAIVPIVSTKLPLSRLLGGNTDYYLKYGQTDPPTKPVSELFADGKFPCTELLPHGKTKYPDPDSSYFRQTEEEKRFGILLLLFILLLFLNRS
jgi:hypothetical protein